MNFPGIYGYYDTLNDKIVYIGKTDNIHKRHKQHLQKSNYEKQQINRIIQNNPKRYELMVLKKCNEDVLTHWEKTLIGLFDPKFNYTPGGEGTKLFGDDNPKGMLGKKHSDATRKEISKKLMGENNPMFGVKGKDHPLWKNYAYIKKYGKNEKGIQKYAVRYKGETITSSTNKEALKFLVDSLNNNRKFTLIKFQYNFGKSMPEETKKKISQSKQGTIMPEETKNKIKNSLKGKRKSEEHRKNISKSRKGIHLADETKLKLSEQKNSTGYFRVTKSYEKNLKQGFRYRYNVIDNGKQISISSVDLDKLKEKVKKRGYPWKKLS